LSIVESEKTKNEQENCDICYEVLSEGEVIMYDCTNPSCFHPVHKICVQEFFKSLLNNNELSKLKCPHCFGKKFEIGCDLQIKLIEILLPEKIYTDKF